MRTPPALAVFFALALGSGCASVLGADFDRPAPPVTEAGTGTDSGAGSCVDDSLCPGGLHCVQGTCSCDPTSCPGCCNGGTCEPGTEQAVCGAGGVVCSVCGSGTTCGSTCGVCGGNGQACCAQDSCASPLMCTAGKCACMPNCVGKGCRTSDGCNGVCPGDGGCAASPTVVPSNEADVGELEATSLTLSVAPGSTFDTTSDCTSTAILGQCATVPLSGRASMCVCHSDNLTIAGLSIMGSAALTLLVSSTVTITGPVAIAPGAGWTTPATTMGGAGGSYGTLGGGSGAGSKAEPVSGNATLVPLQGGTSGQSGAGPATDDTPVYEPGGAGGGALQITAGQLLQVQAGGSVSAPGGGGHAGYGYESSCAGYPCPYGEDGGGGGSGGAILLEALSVTVLGTLAASGGGGGGGGAGFCDTGNPASGSPGSEGDVTGAAAGGPGPDSNSGGAGSAADGNGSSGSPGEAGNGGMCSVEGVGGGGGGAGRIRINTSNSCSCTGTFSPSAILGSVLTK